MAALALSAAYMRCLAALSLSLSACNTAAAPRGKPVLCANRELELAFARLASATPSSALSPPAPSFALLAFPATARLRRASLASWSQSSIIARSVRFGTTCERFRRCFVLGSVC